MVFDAAHALILVSPPSLRQRGCTFFQLLSAVPTAFRLRFSMPKASACVSHSKDRPVGVDSNACSGATDRPKVKGNLVAG